MKICGKTALRNGIRSALAALASSSRSPVINGRRFPGAPSRRPAENSARSRSASSGSFASVALRRLLSQPRGAGRAPASRRSRPPAGADRGPRRRRSGEPSAIPAAELGATISSGREAVRWRRPRIGGAHAAAVCPDAAADSSGTNCSRSRTARASPGRRPRPGAAAALSPGCGARRGPGGGRLRTRRKWLRWLPRCRSPRPGSGSARTACQISQQAARTRIFGRSLVISSSRSMYRQSI